ncbi:hypothetical protein NA619_07540 [Pseudomonas stutzeri]|nr:hypothetical protein [Stutzerimonas stutzeri]
MSGKGVHLSPFYDLLCTAVYGTRACDRDQRPEQATLAWPTQGAQRLTAITAPLLVTAGEAMDIKPTTARETIRKLVDKVRMEAPKLLNEVLHQNEELLVQRPELGATLAGEVRLLRSINAIVISEMTAQLDRDL